MANYKTDQIESVQGFITLVDHVKDSEESNGNRSDFLFRGQSQDWPLLPKLARLRLRGDVTKIERLIMDKFKRASLPLTEFKPEDDWDWIALAQHHGLPTRLLDWSGNALAALWFAVKDPPIIEKNKKQNGIIWLLMPDVDDFKSDTYGPFSNRQTKLFRPRVISRRISAQAGAFTVHKFNKNEKVIGLETHRGYSRKLIKISIAPDNFAQIRHRLNMLGVNYSTIYPDIDGLCSHLQWRYSFYADEPSNKTVE